MNTKDVILLGVIATILLALFKSPKPPKCTRCDSTAECELCED